MNRSTPFCDGIRRRDFLRLGTAGLFGLTLPRLLELEACAQERAPARGGRDVSVIFLFLHGGLSTIDTFDLKPDAPAEFRGEFRPIDTNVPGIQVCEHLPRTARQMDKFSLVRSFRHHNSDHGRADHYILTGYFPGAGFNPGLSPNNLRPAHGSIIARKLGPRGGVPPYICLPRMHPSAGAAYLGTTCSPFVIDADPNAPDFAVPDIVPPPSLPASRLERRQELLRQVDRYQQSVEALSSHARAVSDYQREAFNLMTSPAARRAFDIHAEPDRLRAEYGRNTLGQSCLMARRLVEAGVRCVTLAFSRWPFGRVLKGDHNWDWHRDLFPEARKALPLLDHGLSTLIEDLDQRDMLKDVAIVVWGEFGRTPRINQSGGRDHWPRVCSALVAGGGMRMGQVLGSTTRWGEEPRTRPVHFREVFATLYQRLGIDVGSTQFADLSGRPQYLVGEHRPVAELIG
jgi:hypothetical protein